MEISSLVKWKSDTLVYHWTVKNLFEVLETNMRFEIDSQEVPLKDSVGSWSAQLKFKKAWGREQPRKYHYLVDFSFFLKYDINDENLQFVLELMSPDALEDGHALKIHDGYCLVDLLKLSDHDVKIATFSKMLFSYQDSLNLFIRIWYRTIDHTFIMSPSVKNIEIDDVQDKDTAKDQPTMSADEAEVILKKAIKDAGKTVAEVEKSISLITEAEALSRQESQITLEERPTKEGIKNCEISVVEDRVEEFEDQPITGDVIQTIEEIMQTPDSGDNPDNKSESDSESFSTSSTSFFSTHNHNNDDKPKKSALIDEDNLIDDVKKLHPSYNMTVRELAELISKVYLVRMSLIADACSRVLITSARDNLPEVLEESIKSLAAQMTVKNFPIIWKIATQLKIELLQKIVVHFVLVNRLKITFDQRIPPDLMHAIVCEIK